MRIAGRRADGALLLNMGAGVMVILKAQRVSAPLDVAVADTLGPWTPSDNSLDMRRTAQKALDNSRLASMDHFFNLGMSFDEQSTRVVAALRSRLGMPPSGGYPMSTGYGNDLYIPSAGLGEDWVVYCMSGKHYGLVYSIDASGTVTFEGDPIEVRTTWESLSEDDRDDEAEAARTTFNEAIELRQSPWFKNYMKSKKKALTDIPGSLPNLSKSKALATPEMPSSLPNLPNAGGQTTDMPGSPKNVR